jgi:arginase
LDVGGASSNANKHNPSNLLKNNCVILPDIEFHLQDDDRPEIGHFFASALSMQQNTSNVIQEIWQDVGKLAVIGGDHSVAIGTGAGLSKVMDLSKVGMIWIDSHGDFNIPETSLTKSITGYPLAINCGHGAPELLKVYNGNFLQKIVHIGIRDVDRSEAEIGHKINILNFDTLELERLSMAQIATQSLENLSDMEEIWISFDVDVLDPIYFMPGETDVPVPCGMTPREILALISFLAVDPRVKILEIVQLNDISRTTPLVVFCSRLLEIFFGLGNFRYLK